MKRVGLGAIRRSGRLIRMHEVLSDQREGLTLRQLKADSTVSSTPASWDLHFQHPHWAVRTSISRVEFAQLQIGTEVSTGPETPKDICARFQCFEIDRIFDLSGPNVVWIRSGIAQIWWPYCLESKCDVDFHMSLHPTSKSPSGLAPAYRRGQELALFINDILNVHQCAAISAAFDVWLREGWLKKGDPQTAHRYWAHNDAISRYLHMQTLPFVRSVTGVEWEPTFTSLLVYNYPADLAPHRDREQAALTVSILVDYLMDGRRSPDQWPIYVEHETNMPPFGGTVGIGNAIAFTGERLTHRRAKLEPNHQARVVCLHYAEPGFEGRRL